MQHPIRDRVQCLVNGGAPYETLEKGRQWRLALAQLGAQNRDTTLDDRDRLQRPPLLWAHPLGVPPPGGEQHSDRLKAVAVAGKATTGGRRGIGARSGPYNTGRPPYHFHRQPKLAIGAMNCATWPSRHRAALTLRPGDAHEVVIASRLLLERPSAPASPVVPAASLISGSRPRPYP